MSNERGAIISAGLTGSFGAVLAGLKLAFPDMIVPFSWALVLLAVGLLGALVTIAYATLWLIEPKNRRQRIQAGLRPHYELLSSQITRIRQANTYEEVSVTRDEMNRTLPETSNWLLQNMSKAASEKFKCPQVPAVDYSWPGEHERFEHHGRSDLLAANYARLEVLETFLRHDGWDGEDPSLRQRMAKRIGKWKNSKTASTGP